MALESELRQQVAECQRQGLEAAQGRREAKELSQEVTRLEVAVATARIEGRAEMAAEALTLTLIGDGRRGPNPNSNWRWPPRP
jgi:hypothetical protein